MPVSVIQAAKRLLVTLLLSFARHYQVTLVTSRDSDDKDVVRVYFRFKTGAEINALPGRKILPHPSNKQMSPHPPHRFLQVLLVPPLCVGLAE